MARAPKPDRTPGPSLEETGAVLAIDLDAIAANWRGLAARSAPAECAAVVKADGYGCGQKPVVDALLGAGCHTFFVAELSEARRLRAQDAQATVYVLNGLLPGTEGAYAEQTLRPVLSSVEQLREWSAFCDGTGWNGGAALQVDTGMSRLGLSFERAAAADIQSDAREGGVRLLMSHFAVSEQPEHPMNGKQMGLFRALRDAYPGIAGSLANSSGIFLGPDALHDMVRPGLALYGGNPTPAHLNPMRRVVGLEARILQVRSVAEGETVGYGATWTAKRLTRLAILSVGYADGFPLHGGASDGRTGAEAVVAERRCPIVGRVSMDLLAVDVTDADPDALGRGYGVTLLGDEIGIDELAANSGTIPYDVLTSLGGRYRRVYLRGGDGRGDEKEG